MKVRFTVLSNVLISAGIEAFQLFAPLICFDKNFEAKVYRVTIIAELEKAVDAYAAIYTKTVMNK